MKNNKKSKIVLFSVIGLAAISIGTVGFATWFTGIESKTDTETLSVTVDTSKNTSCIVEATLSESALHFGEKVLKSDSNLIYNDGENEDLTITFSKFVVIASKDVNLSKVTFSLAGSTISDCSVTSGAEVIPTNLYDGKANDGKSYFKLSQSEFAFTENATLTYMKEMEVSDPKYIAGYNCYNLSNMEYSFSWGTLFGGQSPCTYYNNLLKNVKSQTEKLKQMEEYYKILQDMNKNLSAAGNTLKLTINVETTAA